MNERARKLLDERFGAWQPASSRNAYWGRWGKSGAPNAYAMLGFGGWIIGTSAPVDGGRVEPYATADEARAALDAALLCSVVFDAEKPKQSFTVTSNDAPKTPSGSFRAKLADEWELRPDGKHVRKATWEGIEFVAVEVIGREKGVISARFRCPGLSRGDVAIHPSGWSKKDRRYLAQLWALWGEHHQEVPGADWREVTKARLK